MLDMEIVPIEDFANVEWAKQKLDEIQQGIDDGTVDPDDPDVVQQQLDLLDIINGEPPLGLTVPEEDDDTGDDADEEAPEEDDVAVTDIDRDKLTLRQYFSLDWWD
jgi:hypothetical protein